MRPISLAVAGPLLAAAMWAVPVANALAQTGSTPSGPTAPNMPAPADTIPEKIDPKGIDPGSTGTVRRPGETLSDTLERTDGVLKPRGGMDPGITAPAPVPDPGTTPIIRPPSGDGAIQPK